MKKIILYCGLTGINISLKNGDDTKILETVKYTEYNKAIKIKKKYEKQFEAENSMKEKQLNETITIQKDGNMWCAIRNSFINLQESLAGFGDTVEEALTNLLKEENKNDNNK